MGYVWRNLWHRKVRTCLAMLGVAVSVAGIVALVSVSRGMRSSFDVYMAASGASLTVFSKDAGDLAFSSVRAEDVAAVEALDGVQAVARSNFSMLMAPRVGEGHRRIPLLFLFGRIPGERIMEKYEPFLVAGRLPTAENELLAGSFVADQMRLKVGDTLPLFERAYRGIESFTVVGVYRSDIAWENGGLVVHAAVLQEKLGTPGAFNLLFVYTRPERAEEVRGRIEALAPHLVALPSAEFTTRFKDTLALVDEFILLVTLIALLLGVLGVLNTMMMSVSERVREIGTLRAFGWPRSLIVRLVLAEGVLLAVVGGLVGIGLGIVGTEALIRLAPGWYIVASYEPATLLKGMAVALLVGALAALYPAWRAANLRPVEALRHE